MKAQIGLAPAGMMAGMDVGVGELHLAVCRRFGEAVRSADGRWDRPSPCDGWDARAVLEHVGFHDVLLLRPLGLKPDRPRDNPQRRWELTFHRLQEALGREGFLERVVEVPAVGSTSRRTAGMSRRTGEY
jgi:Mycothiol maleylpyruvate isomerase N-terminal domain